MKLIDKLNNINKLKIKALESGSCKTMEEFWNEFIVPLLPDEDIVRKWNELLISYVRLPDAVYAIRAFGSWNVGCREIEKDDELRRGFLTQPSNVKYEYFFTDNFYAAYFAKMAMDGYCPTLDEFYWLMKERMFPARYGRSCKLERKKAVYSLNGKDPGFGKAGYKIAHIVNAGKSFNVNGNQLNITELSKYFNFNRGKYSDWHYDTKQQIYVRNLPISEEAKDVLIAHFLRFVNPLNYFLVPKARSSYKGKYKIYNEFLNVLKGKEGYDIAEYKPLLSFVHHKFKSIYGQCYEEYLKLIMLPEKFFDIVKDDFILDIKYGNPLYTNAKTKAKKTASLGKRSKYDDEIKLQVVYHFLTHTDSYMKIERDVLGIATNRHGATVKSILDSHGVTNDKKGVLLNTNIHDELKIADSKYSETLNKIIDKYGL